MLLSTASYAQPVDPSLAFANQELFLSGMFSNVMVKPRNPAISKINMNEQAHFGPKMTFDQLDGSIVDMISGTSNEQINQKRHILQPWNVDVPISDVQVYKDK